MTTLRDPQMDTSTADYTIGGDWEFNNKMTYTSHPSFTADTDIVDKKYVDDSSVGAVNEDNIYYVGKHGNDTTGTGLNIDHAFLTIQKGIDTADTQSPSISSQYVVKVLDAGSYDSFSLSGVYYVHVDAPSAQLRSTGGTYILEDNTSLTFDTATFASGSGTLIKTTLDSTSYLKANEIYGTNATIAIQIDDGSLNATVDRINIGSSNTAVKALVDSTLFLKSKYINGKIDVQGDGAARIEVNTLFGDITVGNQGDLYIIVNGIFTGNITAVEGATIKMLIGTRTSGYTDNIDTNATVDISYIGQHQIFSHRNMLIGADYIVNPRQEKPDGIHSAVSDNTYVADNTIYLCPYNGLVDISIGSDNNLKGTFVGAVVERYGYFIPIENKDAIAIVRAGVASISARAAWTAGPRTGLQWLQLALISWDGAADAFSTDPVSTWTAPPTLKTNWHYENSITGKYWKLNLIGNYETYKVENIVITTPNITNMGIFLFCADPIPQVGNVLEVSNLRVNAGPFAEDFLPRPQSEEISLCQRYYCKSYDSGTEPGTATRTGSQSVDKAAGGTNQYIGMNVRFPSTMLKTPSLTPYSTQSGASGHIYVEGVGDSPSSGVHVGDSGGQITQNTPLSGTFHASYQWIADARV